MAVHRAAPGEGPLRVVRAGGGTGSITLYDFEPTLDRLCDDVTVGLSATPKKLPSKYFYDARGARLFERITGLDSYYLTRTEVSILREHGDDIAERIGSDVRLVEFGSGSGEKTWGLLRHLRSPAAYLPVDISRSQLVQFAMSVASSFPDLQVSPVCADYTSEFELPPQEAPASRCVAFFPGSTFGNFDSEDADRFLRRVATLVGPEGGMLVGIDLRKDRGVIERAYNDPEGVTAEFNRNLLRRINRECGADFEPAEFDHQAVFEDDPGRIEMRLVSRRRQTVSVASSTGEAPRQSFGFEEGEPIITEYSHKYRPEEFERMAERSGWTVAATWMDDRQWFAVVLLENGRSGRGWTEGRTG